MKYSELQMADYLSPFANVFSNEQKREIFAIRNKMIKEIPANFCSSEIKHACLCGGVENMEHLYICKQLNSEKMEVNYDYIYSNDIHMMKIVYDRFEQIMRKRTILLNKDDNNE